LKSEKTGTRGTSEPRKANNLVRIKHKTVTCVIRCRGRILLLRRAPTVLVNPDLWSAVTGRVEHGQSFEASAFQEICEETGLERRNLTLVRRGRGFRLRIRRGVVTLVQPFLFDSRTRLVRLNWEHTDSKWVRPVDLHKFRLIPKFNLTLKSVEPV
jgi:8-oxo-dGTP pyrophosphatase MutT (NUDIX family)